MTTEQVTSNIKTQITGAEDGHSILSASEALGLLCLHVKSIIGISGNTPYADLLQRLISNHHTNARGPGHIRDGTLIKKFYTKKLPEVSLEDYLQRLHRHCPMSAAVYLATSWYITRMALVEKIIPVTSHNAHRLVLGGLRVATKILEDLHHSHKWFSTVGGVTEKELSRLEIHFCYLMDFDLKIDNHILSQEISMFQHRCDNAFQEQTSGLVEAE